MTIKWFKWSDVYQHIADGWRFRTFTGSAAFGVWMQKQVTP